MRRAAQGEFGQALALADDAARTYRAFYGSDHEHRRAADLTKLMLPFTPDAVLADLAAHKAAHPESAIAAVHFFPLGGIGATTDYTGTLVSGPRRALA